MNKFLNEIQSVINEGSVLEKLGWMIQSGENGYEKWLQHELAYSLAKKQHDVYLELDVEPNKTRSAKTRFNIDIAVRMKGQSKSCVHAVEIKIAKNQSSALRHSIRDLIKISKIKSRSWDFRSVTALVIVSSDNVGKYKEFWSDLDQSKSKQWLFESLDLGKTGGKIYFLSWNQPPRNSAKDSFDEFVNYIIKISKIHNLMAIQNGIKRSTPKSVWKNKNEKAKLPIEK